MLASLLLKLSLGVLVLAAAGRDIAERRIPNRLLLAALALAIPLQFAAGGLPALLSAAAGAATGLVLFLPLYLAHGMGAGDLKLMAAVGLFCGPACAVQIALAACIAGGPMTLGFMLAPPGAGPRRMPYAPAIAAGTLAVLAYQLR